MTGRWTAGSSRRNIRVVCATCSVSRRKVLLPSVSLRVRVETEVGLPRGICPRTERDSSGSCLCPPAWRAKRQWWKTFHWGASSTTRTGCLGTVGTAMLGRNYARDIHKFRLVCSAPAFCQRFSSWGRKTGSRRSPQLSGCDSTCWRRMSAAPLRRVLLYTAVGHWGVNSPPSTLCLSK